MWTSLRGEVRVGIVPYLELIFSLTWAVVWLLAWRHPSAETGSKATAVSERSHEVGMEGGPGPGRLGSRTDWSAGHRELEVQQVLE